MERSAGCKPPRSSGAPIAPCAAWRFEHYGYEGLLDRRRGRPSPRRAPVAEVQRVLRLYREHYLGFNGRHFYQIACRDYAVTLSYTYVKTALQLAGLLPKRRARGRHRRRREPRPCSANSCTSMAVGPEQRQTLLAIVDDATKQLLHAELLAGGESTVAIMTASRHVLTRWGLPGAVYTDRAHWAVHTPTRGSAPDPTRRAQFGRALARLGIEDILSFSPQARAAASA